MTRCITPPANYWLARVENDKRQADENARAARRADLRDSGDLWFIPATAIWLALALAWAWAPTVNHGAVAVGHSLMWSAVFALIVTAAIIDTRRERSIFS